MAGDRRSTHCCYLPLFIYIPLNTLNRQYFFDSRFYILRGRIRAECEKEKRTLGIERTPLGSFREGNRTSGILLAHVYNMLVIDCKQPNYTFDKLSENDEPPYHWAPILHKLDHMRCNAFGDTGRLRT